MENRTYPPATDALTLETIVALLTDRRRRYVVEILSERESTIPRHELATAVASRETETGPEDVSAETTREIVTTLHHVHLPKLDDAGIVDYETATNAVTPVRTEVLTPLLRFLDDGETHVS